MIFPPWKLKRVKQCAKCPWKVGTNPHDIPQGYTEELHRALASTIAEPGVLPSGEGGRHVMACHESPPGEEAHCLGWLMHQINRGNDLEMRLRVMTCENIRHVQLDGPQHESFEDTLPRDRAD